MALPFCKRHIMYNTCSPPVCVCVCCRLRVFTCWNERTKQKRPLKNDWRCSCSCAPLCRLVIDCFDIFQSFPVFRIQIGFCVSLSMETDRWHFPVLFIWFYLIFYVLFYYFGVKKEAFGLAISFGWLLLFLSFSKRWIERTSRPSEPEEQAEIKTCSTGSTPSFDFSLILSLSLDVFWHT